MAARRPRQHTPNLTVCLRRATQAAEALQRGKETYLTGERMAALKQFELALKTMARCDTTPFPLPRALLTRERAGSAAGRAP